MMEFKSPWILIGIPFVIGILFWFSSRSKSASFRFPGTRVFEKIGSSWKMRLFELPFLLRIVAVVLFIVALAGPRSVLEETVYKADAIDILLAIDASGSMAAEDFTLNGKRANRLAVVKDVVKDFVNGRKHDRIGLVTFAGAAYTICPLTMDYGWLSTNLDRIELGVIRDGTAIGSAINTSLLRLKESEAKSKVLILLSDGENNAGETDPLEAARAAEALGVKIYTIAAGTKGYAPFPVRDIFGRTFYKDMRVQVDEVTLKRIADITGGLFFRATDTASLRLIYDEIDALERTEIEQFGYREYKELFPAFLLPALFIFLVELLLTHTVLLRIP